MSTGSVVEPAAPAPVLRLEALLDDVLKQSLHATLTQRDALYTQVAQCEQLCALFREMTALSRYHASRVMPDGDDKATTRDSSPTRAHTTAAPPPPSPAVAQRNHILVDLGNHVYAPALVRDATSVHVNVGCGVVLRMSTDDAVTFVRKKQRLLREMAQSKTREALRIKYRIRLVTEAIARLHERGVTQTAPARNNSMSPPWRVGSVVAYECVDAHTTTWNWSLACVLQCVTPRTLLVECWQHTNEHNGSSSCSGKSASHDVVQHGRAHAHSARARALAAAIATAQARYDACVAAAALAQPDAHAQCANAAAELTALVDAYTAAEQQQQQHEHTSDTDEQTPHEQDDDDDDDAMPRLLLLDGRLTWTRPAAPELRARRVVLCTSVLCHVADAVVSSLRDNSDDDACEADRAVAVVAHDDDDRDGMQTLVLSRAQQRRIAAALAAAAVASPSTSSSLLLSQTPTRACAADGDSDAAKGSDRDDDDSEDDDSWRDRHGMTTTTTATTPRKRSTVHTSDTSSDNNNSSNSNNNVVVVVDGKPAVVNDDDDAVAATPHLADAPAAATAATSVSTRPVTHDVLDALWLSAACSRATSMPRATTTTATAREQQQQQQQRQQQQRDGSHTRDDDDAVMARALAAEREAIAHRISVAQCSSQAEELEELAEELALREAAHEAAVLQRTLLFCASSATAVAVDDSAPAASTTRRGSSSASATTVGARSPARVDACPLHTHDGSGSTRRSGSRVDGVVSCAVQHGNDDNDGDDTSTATMCAQLRQRNAQLLRRCQQLARRVDAAERLARQASAQRTRNTWHTQLCRLHDHATSTTTTTTTTKATARCSRSSCDDDDDDVSRGGGAVCARARDAVAAAATATVVGRRVCACADAWRARPSCIAGVLTWHDVCLGVVIALAVCTLQQRHVEAS